MSAVTVTVTASVASAGSAYEIRMNGVVDQDGIVPLAVGAGNVLTVIVTAQDGESSQTYTVTVTRAGSSEASLSGLSLSGDGGEVVALSPAFASGTTAYTAAVAHDVSDVAVTVSVAAGAAYEVTAERHYGPRRRCATGGWRWQRGCGSRDGAGRGELADVHSDGDAGWVGRCEPECAVADPGDAIAGVCVGDYGRTRRQSLTA